MYTYIYVRVLLSVGFIFVVSLFRVIITTNCVALTRCMIVSCVIDHELASSLLFQCTESVLSALVIFGLDM
jgi:hypothetical protein